MVQSINSSLSAINHESEVRLLQTRSQRVLRILSVAALVAAPFILSSDFDPPMDFPWSTWFTVLNLVVIASIGAVAMNLLVGFAGQVSVAHVAFLILGSMVGGQFGEKAGLPFWWVLPISAVAGAIMGLLVGLPGLRVRGLYLFMATMAVHFIAIFIFQKYQVSQFGFSGIVYTAPTLPSWLEWIPGITTDANGEFAIRGNFRWYWVNLGVAVLSIGFVANLLRSSYGRAFVAVRENDVAASMMGINTTRIKLIAFSVSSALVSVSGVLLAYYLGARSDESWTLELVLDYVTMIVVGGFGSILGGVLGAGFFYGAPVMLSWIRELPLFDQFGWIRENGSAVDQMLYGFAVVLVLLFKPTGLAGVWSDIRDVFLRWFEVVKRRGAK